MEITLVGLWFFLLVLIPIVYGLTLNFCYNIGEEKRGLLFRSLLAVVGYICLSALAGAMILFITIGPHPDSNRVFTSGEFLGGLIVISGYGFFGWVLCSFVAEENITLKKFRNGDSTQSIFDEI